MSEIPGPRQEVNPEIIDLQDSAINIAKLYTAQILDSTGVPLDSDRDKKGRVPQGINFNYQKNPFGDSRGDAPMSMFEYERLRENYPECIAISNFVKKEMFTLYGEGEELCNKNMMDLLSGLRFLPQYLVVRSESTLSLKKEIPPAVIVLSNAASGASAALGAHRKSFLSDADFLKAPADVEGMAEAAQKSGKLVDENGHACVAHPNQIKHFLKMVVDIPGNRARTSDINGLIDYEDVQMLRDVSENLRFSYSAIEEIVNRDESGAESVRDFYKTNPEMVLDVAAAFASRQTEPLYRLSRLQWGLNNLMLGRPSRFRSLQLADLEPLDLEMSKVVEEILIERSKPQLNRAERRRQNRK